MSAADQREAPGTSATTEVDVVVVGYGPVGQVLALVLAQQGHRVAVVERHPGLYGLPRAAHLDHETMRILQRVGLTEELEPLMVESTAYIWVNQHGQELIRFDWDHDGISGWHSDYYFYQPDIEDALDRAVRATGRVELLLGYEGQRIEQDDEGVTVHAATRDGSDQRAVRARYLVGADGGNSFVRRELGIEQEDLGFD